MDRQKSTKEAGCSAKDQPSTSQQNSSTPQKFGLKFGNKLLVLRVANKTGKQSIYRIIKRF